MSRFWRLVVCLVAGSIALLSTSAAFGAPPRQVVVGDFEGERAEAIRDALLFGLAGHDEIRLLSLSHARKVAQRLEADLGEAGGVKQVSSALGLAAFVDGNIKSGTTWTATIRVRAGIDGEVNESIRFTAGNDKQLISKLRKSAWAQVGPALLDTQPARAGAAGHEIVVGPFSGPKAAAVRGYVIGALKKGKRIRVVADKQVKQSGIKLGNKSTDQDFAAVAETTSANGLLQGTVTTKGRAFSVEIAVRSGADGKQVESVMLEAGSLKALQQLIDKELVAQLEEPLSKTAGPSAPEEELPEGAGAATSDTDDELED
jgi:hypothetical protein